MGAADLFKRRLADIFLYRALVLVNAYDFAKFSLPNSITFGDTDGVPQEEVGAADLLRRRLAGNIYNHTYYLQMPTTVRNSTP